MAFTAAGPLVVMIALIVVVETAPVVATITPAKLLPFMEAIGIVLPLVAEYCNKCPSAGAVVPTETGSLMLVV